MNAREVAELLRDTNRKLRRSDVERKRLAGAVGSLAVLTFGLIAGLIITTAISFVVGFIGAAESDWWMHRRGLDRIPGEEP